MLGNESHEEAGVPDTKWHTLIAAASRGAAMHHATMLSTLLSQMQKNT